MMNRTAKQLDMMMNRGARRLAMTFGAVVLAMGLASITTEAGENV
jgi:hypothetical protein